MFPISIHNQIDYSLALWYEQYTAPMNVFKYIFIVFKYTFIDVKCCILHNYHVYFSYFAYNYICRVGWIIITRWELPNITLKCAYLTFLKLGKQSKTCWLPYECRGGGNHFYKTICFDFFSPCIRRGSIKYNVQCACIANGKILLIMALKFVMVLK